ncbi:MAG: DUF2177 family protein [Rhizobiales bacterium]|nr:DUF2177 family protein [Hyphomicrobiales bacterium]
MKLALSLAAIAGIVFLVLDMLWLLWLARGIYASEIGAILKPQPNLWAAMAFYLLYLVGVTFFVLVPAAESGSIVRAILLGGLFGLVAYGTYDLTNLATLQGFTARIALIDMTWGTFVTAAVSGISVAAVRVLKLV